MRPFFTYFGGKWKVAPRYPRPQHDVIIEPFAGSAGYSVRYYRRQVHLYDADPVIVGVWSYLIAATRAEIMRLPLVFQSVDELHICQEARWLIGFWLSKGNNSPSRLMTSYESRQESLFWSDRVRARIALQVPYIKHWRIEQSSYADVSDRTATWFLDPPYQHIDGAHYTYNRIDYEHLSQWSQSRSGQVIVCEQDGADWLPFRFFAPVRLSGRTSELRYSDEVMWYRERSNA